MEYAFRGLAEFIGGLMILCAIFIPLGIWKLVDLVIWAGQHISFH